MSNDFYENDIFNMGDNCIETDGGGRNMRVLRNRCVNTALEGLSAQPIFGGPVYFIRNVVYNGPGLGLAEVRVDAERESSATRTRSSAR